MADHGTKTAGEIEVAGERLLAWAKDTGGVLTIAATFGSDEESGGMVTRPEALFAASMGGLTETEVAVLLAQLDVAVLFCSRGSHRRRISVRTSSGGSSTTRVGRCSTTRGLTSAPNAADEERGLAVALTRRGGFGDRLSPY